MKKKKKQSNVTHSCYKYFGTHKGVTRCPRWWRRSCTQNTPAPLLLRRSRSPGGMSEVNQVFKNSSLTLALPHWAFPHPVPCGPRPCLLPQPVLPPGPGHLGSQHRLQDKAKIRFRSVGLFYRLSSLHGLQKAQKTFLEPGLEQGLQGKT